MNGVRLIAMDMDGTLTQHRTQLESENRARLDRLGERYRLVIVGAGTCARIHEQMRGYPLDIIGCYGMQVGLYNAAGGMDLALDERVPLPDREVVLQKADALRAKYGFIRYAGDSVEFHDSGMMTFALLGTRARIEDKLAFDPLRVRRAPMYADVCAAFDGYAVFIGGSSSFDIVPAPYTKLYAIDGYCRRLGYAHRDIIYYGDDFGEGGNDAQVFDSDIRFVTMKDYRDFPHMTNFLLL